jgi:hypothetical protein
MGFRVLACVLFTMSVAEAASSGLLFLSARVPATTRVVLQGSRVAVKKVRYFVQTNHGPNSLRTKINQSEQAGIKVVTITPQ